MVYRRKRREYKPEDYTLYVWPDPPSGDPDDYGPTEMQQRLFLYHLEPWDREHFHNLDIVLMVGAAGSGKCWQMGTPILKYDGNIVPVEALKVGDNLMGPDSLPRTIISLARGREVMYRITPTKGEPFVCNESHILSLERSVMAPEKVKRADGSTRIKPLRYGGETVVNVSVKEYLSWSNTKKSHFKLYRAEAITFPVLQSLPLDPYLLGAWLGDGSSNTPAITTMDEEILDALKQYSSNHPGTFIRSGEEKGKARTYYLSTGNIGNSRDNPLLTTLREINVLNNKHIPLLYKTSSIEDRLQLLAGLLDTDGHYQNKGHFEITQKNKTLAEDILFLCRSLGLAAYMSEVQKSCMYKGERKEGTYYQIHISGELSVIPTRLSRKKATPRRQKKSVLHTDFTLERLPEDNYYGFTLAGPDRRHLLGDFTVVHNSLCCIAEILELTASFPKCVAIVGGVDMPLLKRNVVDKFGERLTYTDKDGIEYPWEHPLVLNPPAEKTPIAKLINGSSIRFLNIDDPDKVRGFTGDVFMIEEANLMEGDSLREMFRRSRGMALPVRQVILNMNPTGRRDWVYDMFSLRQFEPSYEGPPIPIGDPCTCEFCHVCMAHDLGNIEWSGGEKKIGPNGKFYAWEGGECLNPDCPTYVDSLKKGKPKRQKKLNSCPGHQHYYRVIRSRSFDNPHIPQDYVQLQKGALSEEEYAMYVKGEIVNARQGYIYKEFNSANIRTDLKFDWDKDIYWTHDFNFEPMCSLICQDAPEGVHVVDEFVLWDYDELMVAKHFVKQYSGFKKTVYLYGDPNGLNTSRADSNTSSFKVLYDYLKRSGFNVQMGDKMVKKKGEMLIPIITRVNNLKAIIKDYEGVSRLFVSDKCPTLIESLNYTQWDENSPSRPKECENCDAVAKTNPKRFTGVCLMTHPQAALGYMISKRFPLLSKRQGLKMLESPVISVTVDDQVITVREKEVKEEKTSGIFQQEKVTGMFDGMFSGDILRERLEYEKKMREEYEKKYG